MASRTRIRPAVSCAGRQAENHNRPGRAGSASRSARHTVAGCAVSVVIPAYNEDERLVRHLRRLWPALEQAFGNQHEVIIVDDGSVQPVQAVLEALPQTGSLRVIRHERNRGKGAALRTGFLAARGQCVLFADADGATPPEDLLRLAQAISLGADFAVGCRVRGAAAGKVKRLWYRRLGGRLFAVAARWLTGCPVVDTQIGFKALDRDRMRPLVERTTETGYLFDLELLTLAWNMGKQIRAVPVRWTECPGSRLSFVRDGVRMVIRLAQLRGRGMAEALQPHAAQPSRPGRPTAAGPNPDSARRVRRSNVALFARYAPLYDGAFLHRWFFRPTYRAALQLIPWPRVGRVLDVGSGTCGFANAWPDSLHQRLWYVGVDPLPRNVHGQPVVRSEAEHLPFRSGVFDVVVCLHAAHHFRSLRQAVAEISRVVRPGGLVILADGNVDTFTGRLIHGGIVRLLERTVYFAKSDELAELLSTVGLHLERWVDVRCLVPVRAWAARKRDGIEPVGGFRSRASRHEAKRTAGQRGAAEQFIDGRDT